MKRAVTWLRTKWTPNRAPEIAGAYQRLFLDHPDGRLVLADLAKFCHATSSTIAGAVSDREAFVNEGMRVAFLHILETAGLDMQDFPAELAQLREVT